VSKLQDFIAAKLQESLEHDEADADSESWAGGVVTAWIVLVEVMPPTHVSEHTVLLALAAEHQRTWQTKGMLIEAMDMERREGL
jgi:hypothetical protein